MFSFLLKLEQKESILHAHVNFLFCFIGKDETKPEIRYNEKV